MLSGTKRILTAAAVLTFVGGIHGPAVALVPCQNEAIDAAYTDIYTETPQDAQSDQEAYGYCMGQYAPSEPPPAPVYPPDPTNPPAPSNPFEVCTRILGQLVGDCRELKGILP